MMKKRILLISILLMVQFYDIKAQTLEPAFCEMLGLLDENVSRFDLTSGKPIDAFVAHFYPHEKQIANYFFELTKTFEKRRSENFNLRCSVDFEGHTDLYSKSLANLINSYYRLDRNNLASLDRSIILQQSIENKKAYLKGVYLRFGNGHVISMPNGLNKLKTVLAVMQSLDIQAKVYKNKADCIPMDYILVFPDSEYLKNNKGEPKIDIKQYEEIK